MAQFALHADSFARRLRADESAVRITQIETDLSDYHHGGRTVIRVGLQRRGNWFYKPRSGYREAQWFRLLALVNDADFKPEFFTPQVFPGRGHCWMQAVPTRPWRGVRDSILFYHRAGALLYLGHMFRAVDLHAANFVVHNEHPVLIDCETLFHPDTKLPQGVVVDESSVMRTGMLSNFAPTRGRSLVPHIDSLFSFRGQLPTVQIRQEVARGFSAMHRFLAARGRNADVKRAIRSMRQVKSRYIYRPTRWYEKLLDESLASDHLSSVGARERLLRQRLDNGLCVPAVVESEVRQLLAGDIPIFYGPAARERIELTDAEYTGLIATVLC